jgi:hypothetical protein
VDWIHARAGAGDGDVRARELVVIDRGRRRHPDAEHRELQLLDLRGIANGDIDNRAGETARTSVRDSNDSSGGRVIPANSRSTWVHHWKPFGFGCLEQTPICANKRRLIPGRRCLQRQTAGKLNGVVGAKRVAIGQTAGDINHGVADTLTFELRLKVLIEPIQQLLCDSRFDVAFTLASTYRGAKLDPC